MMFNEGSGSTDSTPSHVFFGTGNVLLGISGIFKPDIGTLGDFFSKKCQTPSL